MILLGPLAASICPPSFFASAITRAAQLYPKFYNHLRFPLCIQRPIFSQQHTSLIVYTTFSEFSFHLSLGLPTSTAFPWASLVVQMVNRLPVMRETWVRSLGWEDPLEKEMVAYSSTLENSMDGGAWWATLHGVAKSQTRLSNFIGSLLSPEPSLVWLYLHLFPRSRTGSWLSFFHFILPNIFLFPLLQKPDSFETERI